MGSVRGEKSLASASVEHSLQQIDWVSDFSLFPDYGKIIGILLIERISSVVSIRAVDFIRINKKNRSTFSIQLMLHIKISLVFLSVNQINFLFYINKKSFRRITTLMILSRILTDFYTKRS